MPRDRSKPLRPPFLARVMLRRLGLGAHRDEVESDLMELFAIRAGEDGPRAARREFARDVFSLWWHRAPRKPAPPRQRRPRGSSPMWQDIVFAFRLFRRQRLLFGITIGSLALAIGLTTALFAVLNAVAWPEDGIRDPDRLFAVERTTQQGQFRGWNYSELELLRSAQSASVVGVLNQAGPVTSEPGTSATHNVPFDVVSGNYFEQVGGRAAAGRLLTSGDDAAGAPATVVLSAGLWRQQFDADRSIVGRTIWIREFPVTVIGVVDRGFIGPTTRNPPAFWMPFATYADLARGDRAAQAQRIRAQIAALTRDGSPVAAERRRGFETQLARLDAPWEGTISIFGRLSESITAGLAEAELTALARAPRLAGGDHRAAALIDVNLSGLTSPADVGRARGLPTLAVAILALVVLIACINISNVLLAGAVGRQREIGTRLALGATRWRIVRQLVTESTVLGVLGGLGGLLLATWLAPVFARMLDVPGYVDLTFDVRVLAFAAAGTMAAAIGAGVAPSLYGRRGVLIGALKATTSSGAMKVGVGRLRTLLIGGQATASVILLVFAALFTRALVHVTTVDLGFQPAELMSVQLSFGRDYDAVGRLQFLEAAIDRLRQVPAVENAAVAGFGPMGGSGSASSAISAATSTTGTDALGASLGRFHRNSTTAGFFETVGLPVIRGRTYSESEVRESAAVAVISQSLAMAAWGDANPIGDTMERVWGPDDPPGAPRLGFLSKPAGTRVIGVVGDTVTQFMRPQTAMVYMPLDGTIYGPLLVRASNPGVASVAVQEALKALDPTVRPRVSFVDDGVREELRTPRALATLAALLGATALGLAVVGLFGVTAFVVDLRRHEVSVRMALGATARSVIGLLLRDCLRPVVIGGAIGLVLAPIGARLIRAVFFGVSPYDPVAVLGSILLLGTAAVAAVLIPARRAARIDPVTALKSE